jgi:segregation and condensation protein B
MKLEYLLESLFFVASKSLSVKDLASFLEKDCSEIQEALNSLIEEYKEGGRGIRIIENNKKYQMTSAPENSKLVQDFLEVDLSSDLTPASLETLSIIAYRGPIKKIDIEKIRGINCSLILRNLLIKGLIEEKKSSERDNNEYTVSLDFIKFLGVDKISDLPEYDKFNKSEDIDNLLNNTSINND